MTEALRIQIGTDTSVEEAGVDCGNAVMVESHNGTVCITGPFEGWRGYHVVCELPADMAGEADDAARSIAADPVARLTELDYDLAGWFKPL